MSYRPFGLVPSNLQRSVLENASKNINKPLTRATINTYNVYTQQQQQQRPSNSRQSRQYSTYYYYIFPKIPRPKRNVFYYKVAYVSIVGSIGSKLTRGFSTRANNNNTSNPNALGNGTKRHAFIANTKKLFGKRKYSTNQQNNGQQQQQPGRKRRFLRSWLILTSISVIFFGVVSRRYYPTFEEDDDEDEVIRPTSWPLYLYSRLPLNAVSRLWGQVNSINLPVWLREPAFKLYSKAFGVNLDEMLDPNLKNYSNLGDFFYRQIRPEVRPVDQNALLCSPCDGKVLKFGIINDGEIEQVKGMTYKIDALLGTTNSKKLAAPTHCISHSPQTHHSNIVVNRDEEFVKLNGDQYAQEGDQSIMNPSTSSILSMSRSITPSKTSQSAKKELFFTVIYLAPGDYHRYHSPTNWVATLRRHFVGELYSVAPYFQRTFNNLFVLNERVALLGYWEHGFFSMTPVGATNVGSIKLNFDSHLSTNEVYEPSIYSSAPAAIEQSDDPSESTPLLQPSRSTNSSSSESINTLSTNRTKKVKKNTCYEATYANASKVLGGQPLFKGEEMGGFKLGSTVVLIFEAPVNFKFDLEENQTVKMGQKIGGLE